MHTAAGMRRARPRRSAAAAEAAWPREARGARAGSSVHLALLTSDDTWRLYHVADLALPEQRFELQLHGRRCAACWRAGSACAALSSCGVPSN
jgi:hypothetical protein